MLNRQKLYHIIYEAETFEGKLFDLILIISILLSVFVVMADSVESISLNYSGTLMTLEWAFTILFTIEYGLRIYCISNPKKYIFSFFGIVDLLAILPTYLMIFIPGIQYLSTIRILRVIRVFRILKLASYLKESTIIVQALIASQRKILVFVFFILLLVTFLASMMYIIEGPKNGFTSIPKSLYWAIVTITTVGYGDITPKTFFGQALASVFMIIGYGIIAVPTGIVTAEFSKAAIRRQNTITCPNCTKEGHDDHAKYCSACGHMLAPEHK